MFLQLRRASIALLAGTPKRSALELRRPYKNLKQVDTTMAAALTATKVILAGMYLRRGQHRILSEISSWDLTEVRLWIEMFEGQ